VCDDEIALIKPHQFIISPIHVTALKREILEKMMEKKVTALSFENLKDDSGHNPIVRSMSEIAGSAVMLIAGQYLSNANNGKGVLVGGISGIPPTKVIIIGAGIVGEQTARAALALGASVKIFDNSIYRLKRLQNNIGTRLYTSVIEPKILSKQLKTCDVAVGALAASGGRTPLVVSEEMVSIMRPGSVIVDVSIDHGGCFETSHITTHADPIFRKYDVIHYCVPNIPSGFARTASQAISNVLMPLMLEMADDGGFENLVWYKINIRSGIYIFKGALTNFHLSQRFDLKFTDLNLLIASRR
jgi:alanine dehydrogenase